MKLLLTSGGITNKTIAKALFDLVGKRPADTSVVFILTASNVELGDKSWLINDLINLKKQNFKSIEITDISLDKKIWQPKLKKADILFFEGGNEYHLMYWIRKSGLIKYLPVLLKNKVYVGVSAGSMVVCKNLALEFSHQLYLDCLEQKNEVNGLHVVDFFVLPHLNSPWFKKLKKTNIKQVAKKIPGKVYALDDNSALKVIDKKVEVVSEGDYFFLMSKKLLN